MSFNVIISKTEYTFTLKFSCVHPDWDNNEFDRFSLFFPQCHYLQFFRYIARLIDVQSCSKTSCVPTNSLTTPTPSTHFQTRAGDPKAVKGERQQVSPEVRFKINVSKRPGWKLEIQSGKSKFAASSSSLGSEGSIPTLVTTSTMPSRIVPSYFQPHSTGNSDGTTAERRGLPIVPKATYSTWFPNAASFLKDTSCDLHDFSSHG